MGASFFSRALNVIAGRGSSLCCCSRGRSFCCSHRSEQQRHLCCRSCRCRLDLQCCVYSICSSSRPGVSCSALTFTFSGIFTASLQKCLLFHSQTGACGVVCAIQLDNVHLLTIIYTSEFLTLTGNMLWQDGGLRVVVCHCHWHPLISDWIQFCQCFIAFCVRGSHTASCS